MKVTLKFLKERGACDEGVDWLRKRKTRDLVEVLKLLIKQNRLGWAEWLIQKFFKFEEIQQYREFEYEVNIALKSANCSTQRAARALVLLYGIDLIKRSDS